MKKHWSIKLTFFIIVLLITSPILAGQVNYKNEVIERNSYIDNEDEIFDIGLENNNYCLILGKPRLIEVESDKILIRSGSDNIHILSMVPNFYYEKCFFGTQICISKSYFGILNMNFIFAICRVLLPESELIMHHVDSDDQNIISFVVDEVLGDPIWEQNLYIIVETDEGYASGWSYRLDPEYVKVGDIFEIEIEESGTYKFLFYEKISNIKLFESDFIDH